MKTVYSTAMPRRTPNALLALVIFLSCLLPGCRGKNESVQAGVANATDPQWVEQSKPNSKVAVVFVHGVFGDTLGTWTHGNGKTFFRFLEASPQVGSQVDIFAFGFTSNMMKAGSLDIREAANKLHESLQYNNVMDYPAVVFVAHSMGGLVVLRHLINRPEMVEKVPLVALYATPQEGAQIAVIADKVARNPALAEMLPSDSNGYLQQLSDDWRRLPKRPRVSCGYEKLTTGGVMVVPWTSATRFCDDTPAAIAGADHISIVKPDRAEHDSVVLLINAMNRYVVGKNFAAKLETPDFVPEADHVVFKMDARQRTARLVNSGRAKLRYTIAELSDSALYIVPNTPKDIPGLETDPLVMNLLFGATAKEYRFVLRSDVPSEQLVVVRADLDALQANRAKLIDTVVYAMNNHLADPKNSVRLANLPPGDAKASEETVEVVYGAIAKESPGLPPSANWLLTADLLASANWPQLAVTALRRAEILSGTTAKTPSAQRLAGIIATQSGEARVFTDADTPKVEPLKPEATRYWLDSKQLDNSAQLAIRLQKVPPLKAFGLSLKGDVLQFKGDKEAARNAYMEAASIRGSPSISTRIRALDSVGSSAKGEMKLTGEAKPQSPGASVQSPAVSAEKLRATTKGVQDRP